MKLLLVSFVVLVVLGACTAAPQQPFNSQDEFVDFIEVSQNENGSFGDSSISDTHYAVSTLISLGESVAKKDKVCNFAKDTLSTNEDNIESIYHAMEIINQLDCAAGNLPAGIKKTVVSIAEDEESTVEELFYASAVADKLDNVNLAVFEDVIQVIESYSESDGSVVNSEDEDPTLYHAGLAFQIVHLLSENIEIDTDNEFVIELLTENAEALLENYYETSDGVIYIDNDDSRFAFRTTYSLLHGITLLSPEGDYEEELISDIAEYYTSHANLDNLEAIYYFVKGIHLLANNDALPTTIVLSLGKTTLSLASKGDNVIVEVSDLLGNPIEDINVYLISAFEYSNNEAVIASNQELYAWESSKTRFEFNLLSSKPSQGFYTLRFGVKSSTDGQRLIDATDRVIKILASVDVNSVSLDLVDSSDKTVTNSYSSPFNNIRTSYFFTLALKFEVRNQHNNKIASVQQPFIRIYDNFNHEVIVAAESRGKSYVANINIKDIGKNFEQISGDYNIDLIIGDAFIENSFIKNLGNVHIDFPKNRVVEAKQSVYGVKPQIEHQFRKPDPRPPQQVSFAFTGAVLAPILILFIGMLALPVSIRIPSGFSFITTLIFLASITAIFTLYGWFWLELNMFETLGYLGVLVVIAILSGHSALKSREQQRIKKEE